MRPVYETGADKTRERKLANEMALLWEVAAKENPKMYPIDFCFVNDKKEVVGFAEIKTRTHPFGTFQTYILSVHKVADAKSLASATGKSVLLVVQWSCGTIAYLDLDCQPDRVEWGGRSDRGDGQDMEPVNHYTMERFTIATATKEKENELRI
jgi:hypothetical protein